MTELAKLAVQVDTGDVRRAQSDLAAFNKSTVAVTAALAAATVATIAYTRRGLQNIDALAKQSRQLDGSIIGLRGYTQAASDAGVSTSAAASAAEMLNVRIGEALRNSASNAAKALDRIGVSAQELADSDIDERMALLADAFEGMPTAQVGDELRQLGIRQTEITRLMQGGGDAIRAATNEMRDYGLEISAVDAANIERTNDALARIGLITERLSNQLAIALAPALETVAILIGDAAKESSGFKREMESAVDIGVNGFAFVADSIDGVERTFQVAGRAIAVGVLAMEASVLGLALAIVEGPTAAVNGLIDQMNRLPKINIGNVGSDLEQNLRNRVQRAHLAVRIGMDDINDVMLRPQPSARILETYSGIIAASKEAADTEIEQRKRVFRDSVDPAAIAEAEGLRLDSRADTLREIERLERLFMTEQEQLTEDYLAQQSRIASALGDNVISVETANALKLASDRAYAEEKRRIEDASIAASIQAYQMNLSAMQGFTGAALGALEAYGMESSKLGALLLGTSKVLMVAQAIMAAEMSAVMTRAAYASAAAFAGPAAPAILAAGETMAQFNRGLGYASAALIAATEFAPARELGGQVKAGKSYIVGENGPERITMGSDGHITSNRNMSEAGGQTLVMQVSTGVTDTVRAEIASMMPQMMRMMIQAQRAQR